MTELQNITTSSVKDHKKAFVYRLLRLGGYECKDGVWRFNDRQVDRGALADLRSGLGKDPAEMARVHRHVVPFLPERDYDDPRYYLLATLFGAFPQHRSNTSLGKAFRPLRSKSDSMEARFTALLNAHSDDLADHLRHAISLLKSNEQPIDWFQLLDDLLQWDHPDGHVQLRWARDFYAIGEGSRADNRDADETTNETKEDEEHE